MRTSAPTRASEQPINRTRISATVIAAVVAAITVTAAPAPTTTGRDAVAAPTDGGPPAVLLLAPPAPPTIRAVAAPRPAALPAVAAAQTARHTHLAAARRTAAARTAVRPHRATLTAWTTPARHGDASTVVNAALAQVGDPYRWGGTSSSGVDCSGLVMTAYQHAGINLPHNADAIGRLGHAVPRSQWQPGTVIAYPGHVALYIGGNQMVEAPHPGARVRVVPVRSGVGRWLLP